MGAQAHALELGLDPSRVVAKGQTNLFTEKIGVAFGQYTLGIRWA